MMEILFSILFIVAEALSVVCCLCSLYGEKFRIDKYAIFFLISDILCMEFVHFWSLNQMWSLMIYPIIALYCCLKFGLNFRAVFVNNILCVAIIGIIQASLIVFFSMVLNIKRPGEIENLFINVLVFIFVCFVIPKCNLKKMSHLLQSNEKLIMVSSVVVVVSTILFLLRYKQDEGFNILYYIVLSVSILLIIIAVIDIGKHKIKTKEAEAELNLYKLYETSFRELIDEICARQHEFDNHINAIYSQHCLYKTYEELVAAQREYCGAVIDENHFNKILSNGNPVILSFFYSKFSEMKRKGILVTYLINIGDLKCKVPVYKMVELLGNLLKNAIEAIMNSVEQKIHVMMLEDDDKIQIEVANESEKMEEKRIKDFFKKKYSEKGDKRGYGLYNVKKICEEYDAAIMCKNDERNGENWIVFSVVINKPL